MRKSDDKCLIISPGGRHSEMFRIAERQGQRCGRVSRSDASCLHAVSVHPAVSDALARGQWMLHDNEGTQVPAERMLRPAFCLRAGQRVDADAPILPRS